ncbi:MAG: hypothetical protein HRU80_00335 [Ignavibacteriales bacterium]|nr:MAG: hypothetical protein HRU80_00335 [Ignavibacteriales bacterium]
MYSVQLTTYIDYNLFHNSQIILHNSQFILHNSYFIIV